MKAKSKSSIFFKNLYLFRITKGWLPDESALISHCLLPCSDSSPSSHGWVPIAEQRWILRAEGHAILRFGVEEKVLPTAAINQEVDKRVREVQESSGRFPTRHERDGIKDHVIQEMTRKAFVKTRYTLVWIDSRAGFMGIDTASEARADELRGAILKLCRDVQIKALLFSARLASCAAMTGWLTSPTDAPFDIMDSCSLKGEEGRITYANADLSGEDVMDQISRGMVVNRLALLHDNRVNFSLDSNGALRKVALTDVVIEKALEDPVENLMDKLSSDLTLMASEYRVLTQRVLESLGGLLEEEQGVANA